MAMAKERVVAIICVELVDLSDEAAIKKANAGLTDFFNFETRDLEEFGCVKRALEAAYGLADPELPKQGKLILKRRP